MGCRTIILLVVVLISTLGCEIRYSRHPSEAEIDRRIARTQAILEPQLQQMNRLAEIYRDYGIADAQISPLPAELHIDGGEYVGNRSEILLPVGPHEFKAVWPNGAEVVRVIYVEPARMVFKFDFDYNRTSTGIKANWDSRQTDIRKTRIELKQP